MTTLLDELLVELPADIAELISFVLPSTGPSISLPIAILTALSLQFVGLNKFPDHGASLLNLGILTPLEADFIVVGGGIGGSVVAGRLAESGADVLLFEAGTNADELTQIPFAYPYLAGSEQDWNLKFNGVSDICRAQEGGFCHMPSAKMIGGASAMNSMRYLRGSDEVLKRWTQHPYLCEGWGPEDCLPYYKNGEANTVFTDPMYHSTCGQQKITNFFHYDSLVEFPRKCAVDKQIPIEDDVNDGFVGTCNVNAQGCVDGGRRIDLAEAYLKKFAGTQFLRIMHNSIVTKVIFNLKKATGVEYVRNGATRRATAKKGVILCAGAIHTPIILMLSGVGDSSYLSDHNIQPVLNIPDVGTNLQCRPGVDMWYVLEGINKEYTIAQQIADIEGYLSSPRSGRFTGIDGADNTGFDDNSQFQVDHITFEQNSIFLRDFLQKKYYKDNFMEPILEANKKGACLLVTPILNTPISRGKILLNGNAMNSIQNPLLLGIMLSSPQDFAQLTNAIRNVYQLESTDTFVKAKASPIQFPICGDFEYRSPFYIECFIHTFCRSMSDATGSARMTSVCFTTGLVKGSENLYLADSSIIPIRPFADPDTTVQMVAEKVVDGIIVEHGYKRKTPGSCT